jgi:putative endonuclease
MCHCYILYSKKLDRFYIGSTILRPEDRLHSHLTEYYGKKKFTAKEKDWTIFLSIDCHSIEQAQKIEHHLKKMKSKKYIQNLLIYPEIAQKLLARYPPSRFVNQF